MDKHHLKRALTIAGSDPCSGAGIQADLRTFWTLGVYGASVITSVTAQNTIGVKGVYGLPGRFVALQIDSVLSDTGADAVKTGMLLTPEIVEVVSQKIREYRVKTLVVDPVILAHSGYRLLQEEAIGVLKGQLIPLARLVTPNLYEAKTLTGLERVDDTARMKQAARVMKEMGAEFVLIKGGHLEGEAIDLLYDGSDFREFRSERLNVGRTHGTGCVLSAAITAWLAKGLEVNEAVERAKQHVTRAIGSALSPGRGSKILGVS
ncbi:MAG TPA: bifunctional hydroxymethylpyrimidine kinase/phosphomethylpyrimidine kinase [Candidatus Latescibacteria bacterium]|nr:bifunctional hydroxymethylpyrimidine kinase/phosphomethylpyrimidine kinase [Candidatus Latescibacterota bacterium]